MVFDQGTCQIKGCTRQAGAATVVCEQHYSTWYRRGTTDGVSTGRRPKLTTEQVAEARRMRSAFKSMRDIAQHLGVHTDTVRKALRSATPGGGS